MIAWVLATLLSVTIPVGAEPFLSEGSVYAEIEGADVTVLVFEKALAMRALAEFEETHADPSKARAGVTVSHLETGEAAGRPSTTVDYEKPAAVARLNDAGEVEIVPGVERTRQTYVDLGGPRLVLTVWTKDDAVDVVALSDRLIAEIVPGAGETEGAVGLTVDGQPLETAGETLWDDPLAQPLVIDLVAE
ncbi:MAG: hypothetical protein AAGE90_20410 [Pseudomonadota bacterium]